MTSAVQIVENQELTAEWLKDSGMKEGGGNQISALIVMYLSAMLQACYGMVLFLLLLP